MKSKKFLKFLIIFVLILLVAAAGFFIFYISDYYHAGKEAEDALLSTMSVTVEEADSTVTAFVPEKPVAGVIFYPGGKVEADAYAPLMKEIAKRNILSVCVEMPGNLAVLDKNAADDIKALYPDIDRWYMAGHSLGGAMAASYVSEHTDEYEGLILLASYSTVDISESGLMVCSIYGSEDGILDMEKYEQYKANLPSYIIEKVIDGGCHSYFADYGIQKGDGQPSISMEEQIKIAADFVSYINQLV